MRAEFQKAFNNFRAFLSDAVPELGSIITHWEDLLTSHKNRAIILNSSHAEANGKVMFTIVLFAATVEKNADAIPQAQMAMMEKVYRAVYNSDNPDGIISMEIPDAEYYDPTPQAPNIGITKIEILLTVEYLDDCDD